MAIPGLSFSSGPDYSKGGDISLSQVFGGFGNSANQGWPFTKAPNTPLGTASSDTWKTAAMVLGFAALGAIAYRIILHRKG